MASHSARNRKQPLMRRGAPCDNGKTQRAAALQVPAGSRDLPAAGMTKNHQPVSGLPMSPTNQYPTRRTSETTDGKDANKVQAAPDVELVERSLRGEEEAFRSLYERYRQPVFATMSRILQDRTEAQDATQEVFIKVYRALSTWNPARARFSTWIYRLASNHAIDCWRTRRRRAEIGLTEAEKAVETRSLDGVRSGPKDCHVERALEETERAQEIRRCLDGLPRTQRRVFALRLFQGLKLKEIAAREGHSLAMVKGSLYRAIRMVQQRMRLPESQLGAISA